MIIAVPLMRMMQVAFDEIVGVAAVRHSLVAASRAMSVLIVVRATSMRRRTRGWIRATFRQRMLVHMTLMGAVKMSFMQIVDVTFVFDRGMPAVWTMRMRVLVMRVVVAHFTFLRPIAVFSRNSASPINCKFVLNRMRKRIEDANLRFPPVAWPIKEFFGCGS